MSDPRLFSLALTLFLLAAPAMTGANEYTAAELERLSKQGETLPIDVVKGFPLREQRVRNDTGINVLVDLAHQASFFTMWSLPGELRNHGFRATGSQASLDSVPSNRSKLGCLPPRPMNRCI